MEHDRRAATQLVAHSRLQGEVGRWGGGAVRERAGQRGWETGVSTAGNDWGSEGRGRGWATGARPRCVRIEAPSAGRTMRTARSRLVSAVVCIASFGRLSGRALEVGETVLHESPCATERVGPERAGTGAAGRGGWADGSGRAKRDQREIKISNIRTE